MKHKTMGFPISHKENEFRRVLEPSNLKNIKNCQYLYFETGYGEVLGYEDAEFINAGANIVSHEEVLKQDIICDPKIGDADYLEKLNGQTIFGWVHAVQNRDITDKLIAHDLTAYAWEDMFEDNRHIFYRNNEIAGEAAIMHAFEQYGMMPYNTKVALLGRGNVANGALKILTLLGADVTIYTRQTEKLFQKEIERYDVIVNAILWDTNRTDHIIYKNDLKRLKKGALLIDISCDRCGGIETSIPTTIEQPVYVLDGVMHYVVDHTPSLFYKTTTKGIAEAVEQYIDPLLQDERNEVLRKACCIEKGKIIDQRINKYQYRII